jgi:hypothetical protein
MHGLGRSFTPVNYRQPSVAQHHLLIASTPMAFPIGAPVCQGIRHTVKMNHTKSRAGLYNSGNSAHSV